MLDIQMQINKYYKIPSKQLNRYKPRNTICVDLIRLCKGYITLNCLTIIDSMTYQVELVEILNKTAEGSGNTI